MNDDLRKLASLQAKPKAPRLPADALASHVASLPGWEQQQGRLCKTFRFDDFHAVIAFVNAVAYIAHRQDHHPDLEVHFGSVGVAWSTHDAGGITLNDCICAARVEMLDS